MRHIIISIASATMLIACGSGDQNKKADDITTERRLEGEQLAKRGEYLVAIGGCDDCHTPKNFSASGISFDSSRRLSGHPAGDKLPPIDGKSLQPGHWISATPDLTAWVGPWGMSMTANLTPDSATGIGNWTEQQFMSAIRTGKHMGADNGRPIMPPMPWEVIRNMTDEDLQSVYAYLRSLPPVNNRVPAPIPPNQVMVSGATANVKQ